MADTFNPLDYEIAVGSNPDTDELENIVLFKDEFTPVSVLMDGEYYDPEVVDDLGSDYNVFRHLTEEQRQSILDTYGDGNLDMDVYDFLDEALGD